jgi:hypothetical protein
MAFSLAARCVSSSRIASREGEVDEESDEGAGIEEEEEVSTALLAAELLLLGGVDALRSGVITGAGEGGERWGGDGHGLGVQETIRAVGNCCWKAVVAWSVVMPEGVIHSVRCSA